MRVHSHSPVSLGFILMAIALPTVALSGATINVPADFATIQAAIADTGTVNGDEIVVAPGTYSEIINFLGKAIAVRSSSGAAVTTLDGNNAGTVVTCVSGEGSDTILQGLTLRNGNASQGGGMLIDGASPTVIGCIFRNNFSNGDGGAVVHTNSAAATFINCLFFDNESQALGGAIHTHNSALNLINCTLTENRSLGGGGGGAAIFINSGLMTIDNTIIWANNPAFNQVHGAFGGVTMNYSNYQNGWLGSGTNNIQVNPFFRNVLGDDYRLRSDSQCVDAGNNSAVPGTITSDLEGSARFRDVLAAADTGQGTPPLVDMGAFEAFNDCNNNGTPDEQEPDADGDTVPDDCDVCDGSDDALDEDGDGVPDGCDLCPGTEPVPIDVNGCPCVQNITTGVGYATIQSAIDDALNSQEIVCRPKTYFESIDFLGKAITLRSIDPEDPATVAATVIHGSNSFQVIQCISGENLLTILEGFTITAGNANGVGGNGRGGGMYLLTSGASVRHCVFSSNSATHGGAIYLESGSGMSLTSCTFDNNDAEHQGGAIALIGGSDLTADNCAFNHNEILDNPGFPDEFGGAIYGADGTTTLTRCRFDSNDGRDRGGALYFQDHVSTINECMFSFNSALGWGGAVATVGGQTDLDQSVFFANDSFSLFGGGALHVSDTALQATHCDFQFNDAFAGGAVYLSSFTAAPRAVFSHCLFRENEAVRGGALVMLGWVDLHHCLVADNNATNEAGAIHASGDLFVTNSTIAQNTALQEGNGIYLDSGVTARIYNSVLWNGNDDLYVSATIPDPSDLQLRYSIVSTIPAASLQESVSTVNPSFVNVAQKDYHVTPGSPAIDAGRNVLVYLGDTDLDDNQRFVDDPATADTGLWQAPIVDIGAYEFGSAPDPCENAIEGDINCDGVVNLLDFALMTLNWLEGL